MKRILFAMGLIALGLPLGAFHMEPITMDFDPSGQGSRGSFKLENNTPKPQAIKISILRRTMTLDQQEILTPEPGSFQIFPDQVVLKSGATQVIRVQWKGPAVLEREQAYRIIAEQLPVNFDPAPTGAAGNRGNIQVLFKYQGSIYVVPPKPQAQVVLDRLDEVIIQGKRYLQVALTNQGNAHGILTQVKLDLEMTLGETRSQVLWDKESQMPGLWGENILGQSSRKFLLPWPFDKAGGQVRGRLECQTLR